MTHKPAKRILICPLDWGLGHAGRDIQIIEELIDAGFEVIIGADNAPLFFLQQHFNEIPFIKFPSFKIEYPSNGSMVLKMALSIPKILFGIFTEHIQLKKIIKAERIDCVISDNRYGLWDKKVYSIFIGHQLFIQMPIRIKIFERILNYINHWFINKFDDCWVPDFQGELNLSGTLSHNNKLPKNVSYIGILSRFKALDNSVMGNKNQISNFDILVVLSGPEPQRTIFEKILIEQISASPYSALLVQGKPLEMNNSKFGNIKFANHLETSKLEKLILKTPIIISRSGYSTIMDLVRLGKSAILVATPGQTEQEYLAKRMIEKKWFYAVSQNKFMLEEAIQSLGNYSPDKIQERNNLLKEKIDAFALVLNSN